MNWEQLGKDWLDDKFTFKGWQPEYGGSRYVDVEFNPLQFEYINSKKRSVLFSGGMRAGKTWAFVIKFIFLSLMFPGSKFLIGRKTQGNAEETFMQDFSKLCPPDQYEHQKGYHKILWKNGSEATFWGLDALQSGASSDIKKAEQKLKSHTLHFIFLDQLEEIEMKVFDALQTRLSGRMCEHRKEDMEIVRDKDGDILFEKCKVCGKYTFNQFCMTTNPANFWAYDYFKVNPRPNTKLVETSTLDNRKFLSEQFIENELLKPEAYKEKFFYGKWDDKTMVEGGVFYEEWIQNQRALIKPPLRVMGGIRIFEEPELEEYQIGIDPSLGASDPCSITCVSKKTGKVVATYTAYVPTNVIVEKAVQIGLLYSKLDKPLIVPEATGVGQALIEGLRPLWDKIYVRELSGGTMEKTVRKLGFYTNFANKNLLIENMKELFQKGFPKIYDEDAVNEMNKFIYTDEARQLGAGAQTGYHDDRIMSLMLAFWNVPAVYQEDPAIIHRRNWKPPRKKVNIAV